MRQSISIAFSSIVINLLVHRISFLSHKIFRWIYIYIVIKFLRSLNFRACYWLWLNVWWRIHLETWWRHQNGNIFRVTGPLCGEFTGPWWIPAQRPVTRSFGVFFDLPPNKRLSKQWWCWWFETPLNPLWRHCNECFQHYNRNPLITGGLPSSETTCQNYLKIESTQFYLWFTKSTVSPEDINLHQDSLAQRLPITICQSICGFSGYWLDDKFQPFCGGGY